MKLNCIYKLNKLNVNFVKLIQQGINITMSQFVLPINVYTSSDYNKLRRGYLILIATIIDTYLTKQGQTQDINSYLDTIIRIEKSCYEHAVEIAEYELLIPDMSNSSFEHLYRTRITRITKNLDIDSEVGDSHLMTLVLSKSIDIDQISKMKPEELSPSRNEQVLEKLTARRNQKMSVKVSTLYRCRQCKKNETTVRSVQMRSLDESETLVINCVFCGYKWFS